VGVQIVSVREKEERRGTLERRYALEKKKEGAKLRPLFISQRSSLNQKTTIKKQDTRRVSDRKVTDE